MRLVITGLPGAGKTSLARELAQCYGVPHIEADAIFWNDRPGETTPFLDRVETLTRQESWIYEGHLSKTFGTVLNRADLWVELNPGATRCFARMVRRELGVWFRDRKMAPLKRCLHNTLHWGKLVTKQRSIHRRIKDLPHLSR